MLDTSIIACSLKKEVKISLSEISQLVGYNPKFVVLEECVKELQKLCKKEPVINFLSKLGVEIIQSERKHATADEAILDFARSERVIVATLDRKLKNRLLEMRVPVIYLRAGKKLVLDDPSHLDLSF